MTNQRAMKPHAIAGMFVFLLLGLFAVFSVVMVVLTAQLYRDTVQTTASHNQSRILSNYLMNAVHTNDERQAISVRPIGESNALVITWQDEDADPGEPSYQTLIYLTDGVLHELLTDSESEFTIGDGESICQASQFEPSIEGSMLSIQLTNANGQPQQLKIRLYTPACEEGSR